MVSKVLHLFNKEFDRLHQAALLIASFALLSQILALVRDRLFAHFFGAGTTLDLYYAAFRIPDLLYAGVASLVASAVLIPFLVHKMKEGEESTREFINGLFTVFFVVMAFAATIAFILTPWLSAWLFPGFSGEEQETLVKLTRILLLSPLLFGISNLLGSITQTFRRFFVYALSPVVYNVGIIFGIMVLYPAFGVYGIAFGVVVGAFLHLLVQVPVVIRQRLVPRPTRNINFGSIKKVALLSLPRTIALSAHQVTFLVLVSFASVMAEGSISVFNLSFNLQSVPLAIIGMSYSVAAFPTLARLFSDNKIEEFVGSIVIALRHIIFWSLPVVVLFIILRAQIVRTILGSGQFTWDDTMLTAAVLALFAVSLLAQSLVLLFVRGYYAAGNTKKPLIINVFSSLGTIALAYLFVQLFASSEIFRFFIESLLRVEGVAGTSVLMLPLAYSTGMIINALLFFVMFKKDFQAFPTSLHTTFWGSLFGALTMGVVAYYALQVFDGFLDINTFWGIFLQGLFAGLLGIIAGVTLLKIIGNKEVEEISKSLHSRFWKTKPVMPEPEKLP